MPMRERSHRAVDPRAASKPVVPSTVIAACSIALSLFVLVGRWSLARLSGSASTSLAFEPRTWIVAALALLALAPYPRGIRVARRSPALPMFIAFAGYFAFSSAWSIELSRAAVKASELGLLFVATIAVHRLARVAGPGAILDAFWTAIVPLLGVLALLALTSELGGSSRTRVAVLGGGPNVFGRNMAVLTLACLARSLVGRGRWPYFVAATLAGMLVVLSGSRGALVAALAGIVVIFYAERVRISRALYASVVVFVVALAVLSFTDVGQATLEVFRERVARLTFQEEYDSGRSDIYRRAFELGSASPIVGQGLGGFSSAGGHVYAHNIVLEAYSEGGLLGVLALAGVLVPALVLVVRDAHVPALDRAAFVTLLVAAQFSGDFFDSRGVFVLAVMIPMRHANARIRRSSS